MTRGEGERFCPRPAIGGQVPHAFDDFQSAGLTGYDVPSKKSHEARVSLNSSGLTPTAASTPSQPHLASGCGACCWRLPRSRLWLVA